SSNPTGLHQAGRRDGSELRADEDADRDHHRVMPHRVRGPGAQSDDERPEPHHQAAAERLPAERRDQHAQYEPGEGIPANTPNACSKPSWPSRKPASAPAMLPATTSKPVTASRMATALLGVPACTICQPRITTSGPSDAPTNAPMTAPYQRPRNQPTRTPASRPSSRPRPPRCSPSPTPGAVAAEPDGEAA